MVELTNLTNILITILPFIFGLIALALIPGKKKILDGEVKTYRAEVLIVVYMFAFFILAMGFYYFISLFGESPGNLNLYIFNGIFLEIIALGIMGVNYRNYSLFSEKLGEPSIDERVSISSSDEAHEVVEVSPIEQLKEVKPKHKATRIVKEPEMVACPQCGNAIRIMVNERPLKISCPHCGIEGMIQ